jgi:hypothetical protein
LQQQVYLLQVYLKFCNSAAAAKLQNCSREPALLLLLL